MHNIINKVIVFYIYLTVEDKYMGKLIGTTILMPTLDLIRQECRADLMRYNNL